MGKRRYPSLLKWIVFQAKISSISGIFMTRTSFHIKMMSDSSLPSVVYMQTNVLFALYVFVCLHILVCNTYFVVLFCLSSSCVPYIAGFSGLSSSDSHFSIL